VENSFVFFVSHRWFGTRKAVAPDDANNSKAKSLFNFAKWFEAYWHAKYQRKLRKVYYWMDYFGIDQVDSEKRINGINALPLYISACSGTVEVMGVGDQSHNHGYYTRAWCLLETVLAFRFQLAGAAPFILPTDWKPKELEEE